MKKIFFALLVLLAGFAVFAQSTDLPRLAVVEFTGNSPSDATVVREIVESVMIDSGNYELVSTYEIDKIIAQQGIALSNISSKDNITKLQRESIKYIVTGSVNKQGTESFVSLKMLDVSNAKFFPNSPRGVVNMASMTSLYQGVSDIASDFLSGMTGNGGEVKRSNSAANRQSMPVDTMETSKKSFLQWVTSNAGNFIIETQSISRNSKIAIFQNYRGHDNVAILGDGLITALVKSAKYKIITQDSVDKLLAQSNIREDSEITKDMALLLGKKLGVDIVILTDFRSRMEITMITTDDTKEEGAIRIQLQALAVSTEKQVVAADASWEWPDTGKGILVLKSPTERRELMQ